MEKPANVNFALKREKSDMPVSYKINKKSNPVQERLMQEGCREFLWYIRLLGLETFSGVFILSSVHHYYYDVGDLSGTRLLVCVQKLNQIRHLTSFVSTIAGILPEKAFLAGCYENTVTEKNNDLSFTTFVRATCQHKYSPSEYNAVVSSESIVSLLKEKSFQVMDISRLNGLIYFCAQKKSYQGNTYPDRSSMVP